VEPKTEVKTVPAEVVFEKANEPGDPGHCAAIVFIKWQDVPYTLSATAFYTYKTEERSLTGKPPFNDHYNFVADFNVPSGSHWLAGPPSYSDGPVANDCSKAQLVQQERYTQPARVQLIVEVQEPVATTDPKACKDANNNLKNATKRFRNSSASCAKRPAIKPRTASAGSSRRRSATAPKGSSGLPETADPAKLKAAADPSRGLLCCVSFTVRIGRRASPALRLSRGRQWPQGEDVCVPRKTKAPQFRGFVK
jgi:hypothetical protein